MKYVLQGKPVLLYATFASRRLRQRVLEWAGQGFQVDGSFAETDKGEVDPQTDNVVRANANRLRARLAEIHRGDGRFDSVVIGVPRGV